METVTVDANAQQEVKVKNEFFDYIMTHPEAVEVTPNTVELREKNGLSLFATRDIQKGETILHSNLTKTENFISKRLFISYAKNLPEELEKTLPQNAIIALLVLYEKYRCTPSNDTLWKLYIKDIDDRFPNYYSLLLYSDQDLEEYQYSTSKILITSKLNEMAEYLTWVKYQKLYQYLDFGKDCSSNWDEILTSLNWIWGYTFSTRTFNINSESLNLKNELMIIPFIDFLNTEPNPNSAVGNPQNGTFSLIADRKISQGEEITIQYPSINNYMSNYGFCLDNNEHSFYSFVAKLFLKDVIKKEIKKENVASKLNDILEKKIQVSHIFHLKKSSKLSVIPQDFYTIIRLIHLGNDEEILERGEEFIDKMRSKRISYENEMKMLYSLKDFFTSTLSKYKTTLEQDLEILSKKIENYKVYCAVIIRRDEKIILKNFIAQIDELLKYSDELKKPEYYQQ